MDTLFESIKMSQIHKIQDDFVNSKKCAEDAIKELFDLSTEVKKLRQKNTDKEFLEKAKTVQEKINETVKFIFAENFSIH